MGRPSQRRSPVFRRRTAPCSRQGLERRCRYGARGALALERLSRAQDGRIAWRMKRPLPDGTTHLLFTGLELLQRVASLVPAPRTNLTRFHGVFAPGATAAISGPPSRRGGGERGAPGSGQ
nr:transposase [Corallococcus exercitus]